VPYFLDRHDNVEATPEELAAAHVQDVAIQSKYGVNYLSDWFDPEARSVFGFVDAPDADAAEADRGVRYRSTNRRQNGR